MRDYKCDIFAKSALFCKCLATRGNQTSARLRNQSKNAAFVIYHDEKRITLNFTGNGKSVIAAGAVLTINGAVIAGMRPVFSGNGKGAA